MVSMQFMESFKKLIWIIQYESGESKKKQDILACLVLIFLCNTFSLCLAVLVSLVTMMFREVYLIFIAIAIREFNLQLPYPAETNAWPSLLSFLNVPILLLILGLATMIPTFLLINLRMKRTYSLLIINFLQVVAVALLFNRTIGGILILGTALLVSTLFIPFGSGKYLSVVQYASYFLEIYFSDRGTFKLSRLFKMGVLLFLGLVLFTITMRYITSIFSVELLVLLYIALVLWVIMNSAQNESDALTRKVIIYTTVAFFLLLSNNSLDDHWTNVPVTVFTIFAAVDRIISSFKEIKNIVKKRSLRYLLDEEHDQEFLLQEKFDLRQIETLNLSESILVRQIIIHFRLKLSSTIELIQEYKECSYSEKSKWIKWIEYQMSTPEEISLEEREKLVSDIWNDDSDGELIALSIEYAVILFYSDKDYEKIITLLIPHLLYLDEYLRYILYCALVLEDNLVVAEKVKDEMANFDRVEQEVWDSIEIQK